MGGDILADLAEGLAKRDDLARGGPHPAHRLQHLAGMIGRDGAAQQHQRADEQTVDHEPADRGGGEPHDQRQEQRQGARQRLGRIAHGHGEHDIGRFERGGEAGEAHGAGGEGTRGAEVQPPMPFMQAEPAILQGGRGIGGAFQMRARIIDEPHQPVVATAHPGQQIGCAVQQLRRGSAEALLRRHDRREIGMGRAQGAARPIVDRIAAAIAVILGEEQVQPVANAGVRRRGRQIVDGELQGGAVGFQISGQLARALADGDSQQRFLFQVGGFDRLKRGDERDQPERQQRQRQDEEHLDAGRAEEAE